MGEYELEVRKMARASFKDYYEILGVHRRASPKKIKKAYHSLAKKYHPDKSNFEENYAKQMMQDINEAYEVLGDKDKKAHYDRNFANAGFKSTPYAAEKKQKSSMGERVRQTSEFNHRTQYIKQISVHKYVKWFALGIVVTTMAIFSLKPLVQALLFNKDTGKRSNLHLQLAYRPKAPPAGIRMVTGEIAQSQPAPKEQNVQTKSGFFTLGSTLKDVQSVMGTPTNVNGMIWCYGLSMVYFDIEGKVCGWQIIDIPLKTSAGERDSNATFTTGSTKKEVVRAMGTPTGVDANTWLYGLSMVYFDGDGKVRGWVEIDKKLKLAKNTKPEGT